MRLSRFHRIFCLLCFLIALFATPICISTPPKEALLTSIIDKNFPLPPKAPAINVKDFGAKGDNKTDDTAAIKKAIAATSNAWEQVYFPPGIYLVSDEISWQRFLTLRGAGPRRTVIKLKANAAGYKDPKNRKAVLFCRMNGKEPKHNNTSHSNHILNLSINVGSGNPGAVGIDLSSHNGGGIENVIVSAADNSGLIGIAMDRDGPGPALVNHIAVSGFDYGLTTNWGVYSMTFEYIDLEKQRVAGFLSSQHNAVVRHLHSRNRVPAVQLSDGRDYGLFVLLDSNLFGGIPKYSAIQGNGELFVRNIRSSGYRAIVSNFDKRRGGNYLKQYSSSPLQASSKKVNITSLNLPIEDAPYIQWDEDFSKWANIQDYKAVNNNKTDDWGPAIQAAIDSGKSTVYFPNFTHAAYPIKRDIIVRGAVKRIVGLSAHLQGNHAVIFKNTQPIAIEQLDMPVADFQGSGTVVVKRSLGAKLKIRKGVGKVFIEDYCCGNIEMEKGGKAWIRSYNAESVNTKIRNNGGKLWILGIKTEQAGSILYNSGNAFTEIIGGLIYPAQGKPTQPMYINEASSFAAYHREFGSSYPHVLQDNKVIIDPAFAHGVRIVSRAK